MGCAVKTVAISIQEYGVVTEVHASYGHQHGERLTCRVRMNNGTEAVLLNDMMKLQPGDVVIVNVRKAEKSRKK